MAVKSSADIVAEMMAALAVADPQLDTSIGSTIRKVLDVVGEQIAPAYADSYLGTYAFSVDTKVGADLDDFCAMFGVYRLAATRAIGVVTFSRPTVAPANIEVPANTQIATGSTPQILFGTVAPAVLVKGTTSVSVPVQAVIAGESGNLPADALSALATPLAGISNTTKQSDACTGGVNAESDEAMKARFKRTVFRSMAGTEDMFLGVAIEDTTPDDATDALAVQANVIGASKRWREQVQVASVGGSLLATSTIPTSNVKHVYVGSSVFGEDIDNGSILTEGVHYTFDTSVTPPVIHAVGTNLDLGTVYDLDYEYVPQASRNDPDLAITNRVDIWVAGVAPQQASETTYFKPVAFSSDPANALYNNKFVRLSKTSNRAPVLTNLFLQLAWGPITDFPEALTIDGTTYARDVDYWVVHDDTGFGYSPSSKFGLEWKSTNQPALNAQILLSDQTSYFYNRLPADVEARAAKWKLVTTDLKAHAAKQVRLALNFAVMYLPNYDRGVVQASLDAALATYLNGLGFRSVVQVSDLLSVAHDVPGVDNIRLLNSSETATGDANDWGISEVNADGTFVQHFSTGTTPARARDIVLAENQVPVLYDARYSTRAQNTWSEPTS